MSTCGVFSGPYFPVLEQGNKYGPENTGQRNSAFGHFSRSIYKTDEIKCSNRYETRYADNNEDESCNSYDSSTFPDSSILSDKIFDEISSGNIPKKRNQKISTKMKERKGKDKNDKSTVI